MCMCAWLRARARSRASVRGHKERGGQVQGEERGGREARGRGRAAVDAAPRVASPSVHASRCRQLGVKWGRRREERRQRRSDAAVHAARTRVVVAARGGARRAPSRQVLMEKAAARVERQAHGPVFGRHSRVRAVAICVVRHAERFWEEKGRREGAPQAATGSPLAPSLPAPGEGKRKG